MNKINSNYKFDRMVSIMENIEVHHTSSDLNALKTELNKFFTEAKCLQVLYTNNTDKLFFGMRVYPEITGDAAISILQSNDEKSYNNYYLEIDSKLTDPMLGMTGEELVSVILHEVGHIVYDTSTTDEVKKHIDMYFTNSGENLSIVDSVNYKELLAYALKDSVVKTASLFTKFGDDEMIADVFVTSCGFGQALESGFRKILRSSTYMNKDVDDRFIVMSWVLRLYKEVKLKRLPAIRTLNKAKTLTASQLEKREISGAVSRLNRLEDNLSEGVFEDIKLRFNKKFAQFKAKGIRSIKDDVYELNLRLRTIETEDDALFVIRTINNDISILKDYVTEPELPESERQDIYDTLQELYSIRQKAAKESHIREKYGSMIQVIYPNLD